MKPLRRDTLQGVWCTALLPIDADEAIDYGRLTDDLDHLVELRPHGVYVNGSAGEFVTLAEDEFDRIASLTAERCEAAGIPFQIGASHPSGQTALRLIERANTYAPSAIQITLPDWLPLSGHETVAAVTRMHDLAAPTPIVLYNPPHAKTQISPSLYGTLAGRLPRLIGIKVAGGDADWHARMRAAAPGPAIFVAGHRLAREAPLGARGAYSNVACLSPAGALRWYDAIIEDPAASADLDVRVQRFFTEIVRPLQARGLGVSAVDKLLAAAGGWSKAGTRVRWPHDSAPDESVRKVRTYVAEHLPELRAG
ncbi:dihydrodipicolinate synthase family protein [Actinomadura sp. LD22]|uniref:Dihydrodipicolinate synthase family protein n=1 Tax=Actinomadura physcomitrii TaxID=2650748 RepID=A0A6I4MHY4_9ACTN|nr:dihydrodipicolinate synthase family protein [Actinomadura physcomitrii]MWA03627.1 dihydrodipicolinate synthase family protein [Actinomadura physcomitrii]